MVGGKAVIIGAGALGLGFLAERMAGDYDITLADVSAKAEILRRVEQDQGYTVNVCGLSGINPHRVAGSFEIAVTDTVEGKEKLHRALTEADLVLTVTGRKVLDTLAPEIASTLKSGDKRQWVLFCENGINIADSYASEFAARTTLVDTVMSRMCRLADPDEEEYLPMWHGFDGILVVEDYSYLPLDRDRCEGGPFGFAFSMVNSEEFLAWEDVKLYAHNGMHAFVAYHAYLEGVRYFKDTPAHIRQEARQVMRQEVVPAIAATHPSARREVLDRYGMELLERFFNSYFNDSIERGTRGVEEKLAPGERLVGGCEYIRRAGIEPKGYSRTIEAAMTIQSMQDA